MTDGMEAAAQIIERQSGLSAFDIAVITGAGMSECLEKMDDEVIIPYGELPGFPKIPAAPGKGQVCTGKLDGVAVICLKGRLEYADTGNRAPMLGAIETLAFLGVNSVVLCGGAASVNADMYPGALASITDHIDFGGLNPLIGAGAEGGRLSLTQAYDEKLTARLRRAAALSGLAIKDAEFMWLAGPSFETPAEARIARQLGAELIGTGLPGEAILARRAGLRVCRLAAVTHFGAGFQGSDPSHIHVRDMARQSAISIRRVLRAFMKTRDSGMAVGATPSLRRPQS